MTSDGMAREDERRTMFRFCAVIGRMNANLDPDAVLRQAADGARELIGARYGVIVTTDGSGAPENLIASGLTTEEVQRLLDWQPEGLRLFKHLNGLGGPFRTTDWPGHVGSLGFDTHAILGTTFLGAPIGYGGLPLGYFFLADKEDGGAFGEQCEEMLTLLASLAGNAIANARMHRNEHLVRAELDTVLDTQPAGVILLRPQGARPLLVNREARRMLAALADPGQSPEALLDTVDARCADGSRITRADILGGATLWCEEIELSVPDGRAIEVLASVRPVESEAGAVPSAVMVLQSVDPVRRLDRMYTDLLSEVSHELRTPLSAVKGAAASALESADELDRAEARELFRVIAGQADLMRKLIGDLLDAGRLRTGTLAVAPRRSDVGAMVERARTAFTSGGARHALYVDVPPDLPPVMADSARIVQVLGNLLANAAEHAPEGSAIRVAAAQEDGCVALSVRDEGDGFTPAQGQLLFRRYARGANGAATGAGLGLAICKGLVEAQGGRIRAESDGPGQGAAFTFTIPAASPAAGAAKDAAGGAESGQAAPGRTARILAVDDDPLTLRFVREALGEAGYDVLVSGDHRDIPRLLRTEKPDLVLLDLALPGADGIDLMERLPALASLPVIMLSGHGREETVARALDAGAEDYIVKPCTVTELAARVRLALRRLPNGARFALGELAIDYGRRQVSVAGNAVSLTPTEYELLCVLSRNAGRVVTFDALQRQVWSRNGDADLNLVRMFVSTLRRKLGDSAAAPVWISSVRSVGYRMASPGDI